MNKDRRKAIEAIQAKLDELGGELQSLRDEEQDYFDNMPENMQGGDKGEAAQAAIDCLEEAANSVAEAVEQCNNAVSA